MGVATALAIGGAVASAASTVGSFAQAGKQRRLQNQAQADAEKAMAEAKKALDVNYYAGLSIQKEPYELQREALLSQGAQAIEAGVESERGAAATAGRVYGAQNVAQGDVRTAMGKEMTDLEKLTAQEESRLRDVGVQINMEEAAGAQQAAADAQRAAAQATQAGFAGLQSMGQQALSMVPLYPSTGKVKTLPGNVADTGALVSGVQQGLRALPRPTFQPSMPLHIPTNYVQQQQAPFSYPQPSVSIFAPNRLNPMNQSIFGMYPSVGG